MSLESQALAGLLDALPLAALVIGPERRIAAANARAEALLGPIPLGADLVRLLRHPDALALADAALSGKAGSAELALRRGGGAQLRLHGGPLDRPAGHALLSFEDITALRQAETLRARFVADVSHELRSPLTALMGFIETLQGPPGADEAARARFLGIMEQEAQRMCRLIRDLLSLARLEEEEHLRPLAPVPVQAQIRRALEVLEPEIARSGTQVALRIAPEAEGAEIPGDADQLMQLALNLIENAIRYGEGGPVTVGLEIREKGGPSGAPHLALSVADNGPGIAREHLPRLTERFYRTDESRSQALGGTGLGLAIVKHILNRHRGRLTIESTPGRGSTFTALLPMEARPARPRG